MHIQSGIGNVVDGIDRYGSSGSGYHSQILGARNTRTGYEESENIVKLRIHILAVLLGRKNIFKGQKRLSRSKIKFHHSRVEHGSRRDSCQIAVTVPGATTTSTVRTVGTWRHANIASSQYHPRFKADIGQSVEKLPNLISTAI